MQDNPQHAKTLRRNVESLLGGTMSPEIASRSERVIMGFLKQFYKQPDGMWGHTGFESQMRNSGHQKMERCYGE